MSPQEAVHVSRIKVTPRSGKETLGTWWFHVQRGGRTQSRHKPTQEMELRLLHARSSKLHDRADGQRPRWRTDSLGGAADGGIRPENDCLSSRPQRALLGSVLDAGIYCLSRSDCYGSARRFHPCPDRFPPKTSTRRPKVAWKRQNAREIGYTPSRATTLPTWRGGATQIGSKRAFPIKLKNGLTSSRV